MIVNNVYLRNDRSTHRRSTTLVYHWGDLSKARGVALFLADRARGRTSRSG
ncbi:hypothetical protein [Jidongwangia harbinensis]|uniref:hypothetical protein n=1 Tax=Jidongwangia harbinensis TaxID=2878561 RepID=UPI001CDA4A70|nr:hypothetical protein [Jidongwangia harbinensis]MCA2215510.1 hypothetical protein [Jidongwangia harbinensis]